MLATRLGALIWLCFWFCSFGAGPAAPFVFAGLLGCVIFGLGDQLIVGLSGCLIARLSDYLSRWRLGELLVVVLVELRRVVVL